MSQPVRLRAVVEEVIDHAPGLRSLILVPERPAPRFRPGQFLHLALDPWDPSSHWPDSRPFSIASPPESRSRLRITVSQVGRFTTRVMQTCAGDTVWLKMPYGEFVVESSESSPAVLVAGGTGVAPFISLVTSDRALAGPVRLLYGVRRPELMIYKDVLDQASSRNPKFTWRAFLEDGSGERTGSGRPSADEILSVAESLAPVGRVGLYLAGPPTMISDLRSDLKHSGIAASQIYADTWA